MASRKEREIRRFNSTTEQVRRATGLEVPDQPLEPTRLGTSKEEFLERAQERGALQLKMYSEHRRLPHHMQRVIEKLYPAPEDELPPPTALLESKQKVGELLHKFEETTLKKTTLHSNMDEWASRFPRTTKQSESESQFRLNDISDAVDETSMVLEVIEQGTSGMRTGYSYLSGMQQELSEMISNGVPMSVLQKAANERRIAMRRDANTTTDIIVVEPSATGTILPEGCRFLPSELLETNWEAETAAGAAESSFDSQSSTSGAVVRQLQKLLVRKSDHLVASYSQRELELHRTSLRIGKLIEALEEKRTTLANDRRDAQSLLEDHGFVGPWTIGDEASVGRFLQDNIGAILDDLRRTLAREAARTRQRSARAGSIAAEVLKSSQMASPTAPSPQRETLDSVLSKHKIDHLHATVDRLSLELSATDMDLVASRAKEASLQTELAVQREQIESLTNAFAELKSRSSVLERVVDLRNDKLNLVESTLATERAMVNSDETLSKIRFGYRAVISQLQNENETLKVELAKTTADHEVALKNWEKERDDTRALVEQEMERGQEIYSKATNRSLVEMLGLAGSVGMMASAIRRSLRQEHGAKMRESIWKSSQGMVDGCLASLSKISSDLASFQPKLAQSCRHALEQEQHEASLDKMLGDDPQGKEIDRLKESVKTLEESLAAAKGLSTDELAKSNSAKTIQAHNVVRAKELVTHLRNEITALTKLVTVDDIMKQNIDRPASIVPHPDSDPQSDEYQAVDDLWKGTKQCFMAVKHRLMTAPSGGSGGGSQSSSVDAALQDRLHNLMHPPLDVFQEATALLREFANSVRSALLEPLMLLTFELRAVPKWKKLIQTIDDHVMKYRWVSRETGRFAMHNYVTREKHAKFASRYMMRLDVVSGWCAQQNRVLSDEADAASHRRRQSTAESDRLRDFKIAKVQVMRRLEVKLESFEREYKMTTRSLWNRLTSSVRKRNEELKDLAGAYAALLTAVKDSSDKAFSPAEMLKDISERDEKIKSLEDRLDEMQQHAIELTVRNDQLEEETSHAYKRLSRAQAAPQSPASPTSPSSPQQKRKASAPVISTPASPASPISSETPKRSRSKSAVVLSDSSPAEVLESSGDGSSKKKHKQKEKQPAEAESSSSVSKDVNEPAPGRALKEIGERVGKSLIRNLHEQNERTQARAQEILDSITRAVDFRPVSFDSEDAADVVVGAIRNAMEDRAAEVEHELMVAHEEAERKSGSDGGTSQLGGATTSPAAADGPLRDSPGAMSPVKLVRLQRDRAPPRPPTRASGAQTDERSIPSVRNSGVQTTATTTRNLANERHPSPSHRYSISQSRVGQPLSSAPRRVSATPQPDKTRSLDNLDISGAEEGEVRGRQQEPSGRDQQEASVAARRRLFGKEVIVRKATASCQTDQELLIDILAALSVQLEHNKEASSTAQGIVSEEVVPLERNALIRTFIASRMRRGPTQQRHPSPGSK